MDGIDWFVLATYVLMIVTFASKIHTRRGLASVAGYAILIMAKQIEISKGAKQSTIDTMRKVGYMTLLFSPSYEHWFDAYGVIGYALAILGEFDNAAPFMALYHTSALPTAHGTYFVARACAALSLALGYKNPLI
jgi:hypothetical protein